jgi:peptidyl-prolyl cis-trans isomerase SurA
MRFCSRGIRPASVLGFLPGFILFLSLTSCSPKSGDTVIANIGRETLTLPEYERIYIKSNGSREAGLKASQQDRESFLNLLVKYRLKLAEAKAEGIDRRPEILAEVDQYKSNLASSFLTDREVLTPGLKRLYQRRSEEIRASHVLIMLRENASAQESTAAFQKAFDVIRQARAGVPFDTLASKYSQDPSVTRNAGDVYYFTAGNMVPQFEDAAYSMKKGEFTTVPVRTQYGLHIIKVTDRKPAVGETHCAHIMITFPSMTPTPEDTVQRYQAAQKILDSLKLGIPFADLARRNSQDPGSADKGGDLGWFTRRRWVQPFDEVALALQAGQTSPIIRTQFGYHIIKCLEIRPPKTFDESRQELHDLYQQTRFQQDYSAFIRNSESRARLTRDTSVIRQLLATLDTTKSPHDSLWAANVTPALAASPAFMVGRTAISVDSVLAILKVQRDLAGSGVGTLTTSANIEKVGEQLTFGVLADSMERSNPDFAAIMREYRDGVVLYQVEQENVWNRIVVNDSLLRLHWEAQKDKFKFPERVRFTQSVSLSRNFANQILAKLSATGKTLEQLALEDSVRMAQPTRLIAVFARGSATLSAATQKTLSAIAAQLKGDTLRALSIAGFPDTTANAKKNQSMADRRMSALVSTLTQKLGIAEKRVQYAQYPHEGGPAKQDTFKLYVTGDWALFARKLETMVLAPAADERARRADSLTIGAYSPVFQVQGGFAFVRLDGREASRLKSFEEAAPEVSTAFQDAESKRLERDWMDRLRQKFPVVEHKEVLQNAFSETR